MALAHIGLEQIDPIKFEELVLGMFLTFGFNGNMTPPSGDHGIDIELRSKTGNLLVVQCKRYQGDQVVSPKEVREFLGALTFMKATEGYFVTTSSFSEQCRVFARNQPLYLIDGNSLHKLLVLSETMYRQSLNERSTTGAPEEFIRRHL